MRFRALPLLALLCLAGVDACVSPGGRRPPGPRDPYLITARELSETPTDNLYDAVSQLRPDWYRRGRAGASRTIMVYLDDRHVGDVSALRNFSPQSVAEIRYLSVTEAQVRYGTRNLGRPAIRLVRLDP